jgi:hypothetical protein
MIAFDLLTDADLTALASALRSGRLPGPFTDVAVGRYVPAGHAEAVAGDLQRLREEGMLPQHLALLAETVVRGRSRSPHLADLVDLVWSGPEAAGVVNRDTGVVVRELFGEAETEVLAAGFAVYQGRAIFKRLAERMEERPGLRVKLFLDVHRPTGDASPADDLLRRFAHRFSTQEWPGERPPALFYDPRSLDPEGVKRSSLHAKCIVVDRRSAFVTSANFTEAAQTRNIEVGALVRSARFAARLAEHFEALADAGMLKPLRLAMPDP